MIRLGAIANPKDYGWYPEWAAEAQAAGFSLLTSGDSQSLWADPFVTLSLAATVTRTPRLGITVSNPRTRHPAVVAGALTALNELSGGRVVFGVSSGDSALRNIGLAPAKVAEVAEFAAAVKRLCSGQRITWQGDAVEVRWAKWDVPIWMAAEGPRTQYLAGQIADGVLLSNALEPGALSKAIAQIAQGAEAAGRTVDDIEIWLMTAMCIADSEAAGIHRLRALLAGTANHVYRFHMEDKGVPEQLRGPLRELQRRYDSRHHASPSTAEHNARLVEELGLVDFLASRSVVAGTPDQCAARLRTLADQGMKNFLVHSQANDPVEFMHNFRLGATPHLALSPSKESR